jgi:phosphomevalonate kinase
MAGKEGARGGGVRASCPGKVLVVGGYAVLERPNRGLVLATSAQFHATARWAQTAGAAGAAGALAVRVLSPQYHQRLELGARLARQGGGVELRREPGCVDSNKYVEVCVAHALGAAAALREELLSARALRQLIADVGGGAGAGAGAGAGEGEGEGAGAALRFEYVQALLGLHMRCAPSAYRVGSVHNDARSNQASLRLLAFAQLVGLGDRATQQLWAQHLVATLAEPHVSSHANIRQFVQVGMAGVAFADPLSALVVSLSPGLAALVAGAAGTAGTAGTAPPVAPRAAGAAAGDSDVDLKRLVACPPAHCLEVELLADNDFYSQQSELRRLGQPYTPAALAALPACLPLPRGADGKVEVAKTGLGSSAAMATALVCSVVCMLVPELSAGDDKAVLEALHAMAQLAHNVMQGKIGSGFDVCAAVHGSMQYVRYDAGVLGAAMALAREHGAPPAPELLAAACGALNHQALPLQLPRRVSLLCGDVCGGSETPSMSRQILAWKERATGSADAAERALWPGLLAANDRVAAALAALAAWSECDPAAYDAALDRLAAEGWQQPAPLARQLADLRAAFAEVRATLRAVGAKAQVPVEPPEQTQLCDATEALPGVLMCGVPGAGGFDAVFALVVDSREQALEQLWTARGVCALLLRESKRHPGVHLTAC